MRNGWDDEQLLGALREAMQARQAVPSWFIAMGKNAYAWHNIDAELAQLTYDSQADTVVDEEILAAERNAALRVAFAELPPRCQQLLSMLLRDPPCSYGTISATLDIPTGSIGPQRARCLERMRKSSALLGLVEVGVNFPGGDPDA